MSGFIDLHMHTTFSDGLCSPENLRDIVRGKKLKAFAVTDHDTIEGYRAVRSLLNDDDPEIICGVELSVSYEKSDLHVLAYYFDPENKPFNKALKLFQDSRNLRAKLMVEKLNELGIKVSYGAVEKAAGRGVIGRPHIAEAMYKSGSVSTYNEAFSKYIGNGKIAHVSKKNFAPDEALKLIHDAGGVAFLAHPVIDDNERFIEEMAEMGMDGIEVYHPYHKSNDLQRLTETAKRLSLVISGGSDYHGREGRQSEIGSQKVPEELLGDIKQQVEQIREKI